MNDKVAVVIPIYKPLIDEFEQIALRQCFKILQNHEIFFVKPIGLDISGYISHLGNVSFSEKSFDKDFFTSIRGYNRLMLSSFFYKEFLNFEYMLIYQLDAFVFKDELLYWCRQKYDYIGAPWLDPYKLKKTIVSYLHYKLNKKQKGGDFPTNSQFYNRVGNGGFSLRNVAKFYKICLKKRKTIDYYNQNNYNHFFNEDVFWSLEVNRKRKVLRTPGYRKAALFALEQKPELGLEISKGKLPFGVHAWPKTLSVWMPFIKELAEKKT